ncbi:antitoxin Xre/MbcA/ParS toxin-binding domain-containing protein [Acinetobacter sp.]|uniref:antitoxin Xre/MbcA/ParS toxin-binding domain-containing protein n=1 Tax=Acinetobacter sp. TaxID=472 RepID=UPI0028A1BFF2|nr:antitoxin Xre/MbcA/ParS toxin-binding domain-containing protein [Acinetobacter sp.]
MNPEATTLPTTVLVKATSRIAEQLQLTQSELAAILGVPEQEVLSLVQMDDLAPHTKENRHSLYYQQLFKLAGGDFEVMRLFINSPNRSLDDQLPRRLIQTPQGFSQVIDVLERMRHI